MEKTWKQKKRLYASMLIVTLLLVAFRSTSGHLAYFEMTDRQQDALLGSSSPLFLSAEPSNSLGASPSNVEQIDAFVKDQMQKHGLPGLALALVDEDQVILMKGYGKADPSGRSITPQTPFILASASKPLTATALMQLVETGKVELDAPVQRYLPEFRVADPAASSQITVRHLLLHTSGLPGTACDTRVNAQTIADYIVELQTVELNAPVGTRHSYCSGNYNVLGRIIEVVSGQSFGEYMQEHVFMPLDMLHSFTSEQQAKDAGMAQGYQWFFGLPVATRHPYNPSQLPSGYMISSVEDMSHFLISQLNAGRYLDTWLLSAEGISAMQVTGIERSNGGGYGFGWVIAPVGEVAAVWHDGVNVNFHSMLLMQPDTERGAVFLFNSFGIVAYEGVYQEIEAGVARLLAGMEPAQPSQSLGTVYLWIDLLLAGLLLIASLPLIQMRTWHRRFRDLPQSGSLPWVRVSLRSILEVSFALAFLTFFRVVIVAGLGAQSWYEMLMVFPDVVVSVWSLSLIFLVTGIIRMKLILQMREHARGREAVPDAPLVKSL